MIKAYASLKLFTISKKNESKEASRDDRPPLAYRNTHTSTCCRDPLWNSSEAICVNSERCVLPTLALDTRIARACKFDVCEEVGLHFLVENLSAFLGDKKKKFESTESF